ncbi:hypothetical protein ACFX2I_003420 [Malus domestica]|uniref:putative F-box protein At1g23770 n=1 Tax=Malus domestica TaxID=3750 RepID=UPI0010AB4A59|nr:putative F-box protein At1g23770 [Malus domestica]
MDIHGGSGRLVGNKKDYSILFFLRKVLREVLLEDRSFHKLLVTAVHAVFLEFGFIQFDSFSGAQVNRFHLLDKWPTTPFTLSFTYTMPEILKNRSNCAYVFGSLIGIDGILIRFQKVRNCVYVFGSLIGSGSGSYWDEIVLPLAIDLYANACVPAPPRFMQLPSELQMKILRLLPGVDIALVSCVCKELRDLANDEELWKQKVFDEFTAEFLLIKPKAISVFNNAW